MRPGVRCGAKIVWPNGSGNGCNAALPKVTVQPPLGMRIKTMTTTTITTVKMMMRMRMRRMRMKRMLRRTMD
jgi:hypothetical protein